MNRNFAILIVCIILLSWSGPSLGCLSNTINIGIFNTDKSRLSAELISQIIGERTGTNVKLLIYNSEIELNEALNITIRDYRIDLLVENPEKIVDIKKITISKTATHVQPNDKNNPVLFIQTPFIIGSKDEGASETSIFYRSDLLEDFPLLPRLLTKLSRSLDFKSQEQLLQFIADGEKPRNVARDFLKRRNLI